MSPRANENDPTEGIMRPYGKRHFPLGRNAFACRGGTLGPQGWQKELPLPLKRVYIIYAMVLALNAAMWYHIAVLTGENRSYWIASGEKDIRFCYIKAKDVIKK